VVRNGFLFLKLIRILRGNDVTTIKVFTNGKYT